MLSDAQKNDYELMRESRAALLKIQEAKSSVPDILVEAQRVSKERDMGKGFYDPYDSIAFETKVRVDMMYYDQLLQKLDEAVTESTQGALSVLFKNIRQIYEFVNIKPEIYGKGIKEDILDESMVSANRRLSKVIYDNLDKNFYKLSPEKRKEVYYESSKSTIAALIEDGSETDEAIKFGIKVAVIENLLRDIAFPHSCWARIVHLTENVDYGKIFDQPELNNLVESFQGKIHSISKIVATCV